MKVIKRPETFEATEWLKLGDHPKVSQLTNQSGKGVLQTDRGINVVKAGDFILEDELGRITAISRLEFKALYAVCLDDLSETI